MRDELMILRTSLKRIAQATGDAEIIAAIPAGDEFNAMPYEERGWNALAARLCGWAESNRRTLACSFCGEPMSERDEACPRCRAV